MPEVIFEWPPCKEGDIVCVKWQDPHFEDSFPISDVDNIDDLVHTTTIGQIVKMESNLIIISSERVWRDDVSSSSVHIFPKRVVEDLILLMTSEQFIGKLGSLNVSKITNNI